MTVSSDISNLFKQFGGSPEHYQELSKVGEGQVAPRRAQPAEVDPAARPTSMVAPVPVPAQPQPEQGAECVQPLQPDAETDVRQASGEPLMASGTVADDSAWAKGSLQRLLARLAHEERREIIVPASAEPITEPAVASLSHVHIIAVTSASGGVGKTTLAANLAVAVQAQGRSVVLLDLSPQDALHHHFRRDDAEPREDQAGLAITDSLAGAAIATRSGVLLVPFGQPDEARRLAFEAQLVRDPHWLARQLAALALPAGTLVLLDTPSGPSTYLRQALAVANMALLVCKADAACYNALAPVNDLIRSLGAERGEAFLGTGHLINQREPGCALDRDIGRILQALLGEQILGEVRRDPAIAEALVYNLSALEHAPSAAGSDDLRLLAANVLARLSFHIQVGQLS